MPRRCRPVTAPLSLPRSIAPYDRATPLAARHHSHPLADPARSRPGPSPREAALPRDCAARPPARPSSAASPPRAVARRTNGESLAFRGRPCARNHAAKSILLPRAERADQPRAPTILTMYRLAAAPRAPRNAALQCYRAAAVDLAVPRSVGRNGETERRKKSGNLESPIRPGDSRRGIR